MTETTQNQEIGRPDNHSSPHDTHFQVVFPSRSPSTNGFASTSACRVKEVEEEPKDRRNNLATSLTTYVDAALESGFVIKAPRPDFVRGKKPGVLPGYSLRDWQMKIELRKQRLTSEVPRRKISLAEVQQHCEGDDLWVVYRGVVYDVTEFQRFHPCVDNVVAQCGGHDITSLVETVHPWVMVHGLLATYAVGTLETDGMIQ